MQAWLSPDSGQVISPLGFSFSICELMVWAVMGLQRSFELSYSAVCILQSGHVCPLNEHSATFLVGDRGRRYTCDERAVYRVFSRKMFFHTSLSHYSLAWPCQSSWVCHWSLPCPRPSPQHTSLLTFH